MKQLANNIICGVKRITFLLIPILMILTLFIGCEQTVEKLVQKYEKGDSSEKAKVVEVLIKKLKNNDQYDGERAKRALSEIGGVVVVEALTVALKEDDSAIVRGNAAQVLGEIGDTVAVWPLIDAFFYDKGIRVNAVEALGKIGDARAVGSLVWALNNCSEEVREKAIIALGMIGNEAIKYLVAEFSKDNNSYIKNAKKALSEIGGDAVINALTFALKNNYNKVVREKVAEFLGEMGDTLAVESLIVALEDDNLNVIEEAAKALGKISDIRAVEPLITVLKDWKDWKDWSNYRDGNIRIAVVRALGKTGDPRAVEPLIAALKIWMDWRKTLIIVEALGELRDSRAVVPLTVVLKDSRDKEVRRGAAESLGKIGDKRAIPYLINSLQDWDASKKAASALNELGWKPESTKDIVHFLVATRDFNELRKNWGLPLLYLLLDLTSNDFYEQQNAFFAFIAIGKQESINTLIINLNKKGNKAIAEACLNSGNHELSEAAKTWAKKYGYEIRTFEGSSEVKWGNK